MIKTRTDWCRKKTEFHLSSFLNAVLGHQSYCVGQRREPSAGKNSWEETWEM